jgi:hypothetical protein
MRITATALLALGLAAILVSPALAATIMSETFAYSDGNLVPNGAPFAWANFSGAVTDIQVASGRATGFGPNANDDHALFTPQATSAVTYACFRATIPAPSGQPKPIYFAMLKDGGTSIFVARVYVLPLPTAGEWTFGISYSSTSATVGVVPWSATTLAYGTDYTIAIKYDPAAFTATLWVDPVDESSTSVSIVGTAAAVAVSGFGLRQSATAATLPASPAYVGSADWGFSVDNIGVGTTFTSACVPVPTPTIKSTWGMLKTIYR